MLVLTEHKGGERGDELATLLGAAGYPHLLSPAPRSSALGTAIAYRHAIRTVALPVAPVFEPWRSVAIGVQDITVVGLNFPLQNAKAPFWDWILANAAAWRDRNAIFAGDFNPGKQTIDEVGRTLSCSDKQVALEDLGFVDCWRAANPDGRDYTWFSSAGNGLRLDYVWASPSMAHRITAIRHDHDASIAAVTDHAAVVADIRLT